MARGEFGEAKPLGGVLGTSDSSYTDPFTAPVPQAVAPPDSSPVPASPPLPGYGHPAVPPPPSSTPAGTDRNWMGIVSLVLGILGGGLLGLGFGIAGVRAAAEGRATNKTMSIWGIVLNCTSWIVYLGLFALAGAVTNTLSGGWPVALTDMRPGDCFLEPARDGELYTVTQVVDCDTMHYGQVYFRGRLGDQPYVSDTHMGDLALELCESSTAMNHLTDEAKSALYINVFFPDEIGWDVGDRYYICIVDDWGYPLTKDYYVP